MQIEQIDGVKVEKEVIVSKYLQRKVTVDLYYHEESARAGDARLLLINDGQDLPTMDFEGMLQQSFSDGLNKKLVAAGIYCSDDRKNEYGMSVGPDHQGLGAKAPQYNQFIVAELIPFLKKRFREAGFKSIFIAGFSLGALSALDIAWNNHRIFSKVGVFSGSLWWRSRDKTDKEYNQNVHRMMHAQVRKDNRMKDLKFFFECGELDESEDRNRNGVIDSIDDTIDLMRELVKKGYREGKDIRYLQLPDGRHDVASWGKAMPDFLAWIAKN